MDERPQGIPPRFDASDPAVKENPYPTYKRLRDAGPVCRGGLGQWVVTRYADVVALLSDDRLRSHFPAEYHQLSTGNGPAGEFVQRIILYQDDPKHLHLRRLMASSFDARTLRQLCSRINEILALLLKPVAEKGFLEAVNDIALPLPIMTVCEIMGIPPQGRDEIRPKAFDLGKAFVPGASVEKCAVADKAVVWLRDYVGDLLAKRQRTPRDDLLSRMLTAEAGSQSVSREEIIDNAIFLFFAGFETTTSLISTGCVALLDNPEQLAILRNDPSLMPRAIEEFMRYDAPIQSRLRLVAEPIQIGGRLIKPGRLLLLLLGSANHDEHKFTKPEELDVTRTPNPHVSFGGGDHYCLGASLARLESTIVFEHLLRCFKHIEPAGQATRNVRSPLRTYERVPIAVRVA